MVLRTLDQILSSPFHGLVTLITFIFALLVAITIHEASHALTAYSQGDSTAKTHGRLSLNPVAHLDPLGTIMILFAGFGWGKPVPVNPDYLRTGGRSGMAIVSLAGPLSNLVIAMLFAIPINTGIVSTEHLWLTTFHGEPSDVFGYVLNIVIFWNLLLAAFNLLPIAPLDGFKIMIGVLPTSASKSFAKSERFGPVVLLSIIMLDLYLLKWGILAHIIGPLVSIFTLLVLW